MLEPGLPVLPPVLERYRVAGGGVVVAAFAGNSTAAVLADPFRPERGMLTARGPGLGMGWHEKAVRRYGPS